MRARAHALQPLLNAAASFTIQAFTPGTAGNAITLTVSSSNSRQDQHCRLGLNARRRNGRQPEHSARCAGCTISRSG